MQVDPTGAILEKGSPERGSPHRGSPLKGSPLKGLGRSGQSKNMATMMGVSASSRGIMSIQPSPSPSTHGGPNAANRFSALSAPKRDLGASFGAAGGGHGSLG